MQLQPGVQRRDPARQLRPSKSKLDRARTGTFHLSQLNFRSEGIAQCGTEQERNGADQPGSARLPSPRIPSCEPRAQNLIPTESAAVDELQIAVRVRALDEEVRGDHTRIVYRAQIVWKRPVVQASQIQDGEGRLIDLIAITVDVAASNRMVRIQPVWCAECRWLKARREFNPSDYWTDQIRSPECAFAIWSVSAA
jgi:hypothetical protein